MAVIKTTETTCGDSSVQTLQTGYKDYTSNPTSIFLFTAVLFSVIS